MFGKPPIQSSQQRPGSEREWRLIEKLLEKSLDEQRAARRWGYFFKAAFLVYLFALLLLVRPIQVPDTSADGDDFVALVDIYDAIAQDSLSSASQVNQSLKEAFRHPNTQAIVLRINSPGGSPVQASYVYDEIKRLRQKHENIKVYAVIEELGASAAYFIAAAADEIYANESSLVGSIGVIGGGFGYVEVMKKLGVERRVYTAGEHKAFLDPFQPEKAFEKAFWESVLEETHQVFIDKVQQGRGDRLKPGSDESKLFSGLIWSGKSALEKGLIDGLGSAEYVVREKIGEEKVRNFSQKRDHLERLLGYLGVNIGRGLAQKMGLNAPYTLN